MRNVYLGRQPIIDLDGNLNSYEVLYKDGHGPKDRSTKHSLSASVINSVLNKFGTEAILGNRRAFVKVDEKFLMNDLIFTIPTEFFIFSIVYVDLNDVVIERFKQLKEKGFLLAVNDMVVTETNLQQYVNVLETLSYVKIDFDKGFPKNISIENMISALKRNNIKVVGTQIENEKEYELAKKSGCDLFQGYFFAKPKIFENTKYDPAQLNVLKLYTMLMDDTDINKVTAEFEKNHALSVQLLQFINSVAFSFKKKISSINQIITLVGREPLAQWLMLMIYSKSVSKYGEVSPLMLMVKHRTEVMQYLTEKVMPKEGSDALGQAYFVGVLSLIDAVFGVELKKILNDINIDDVVKEALLENKGVFGDILGLIKDIEKFDTKAIEKFLKKYELTEDVIDEISLKSMQKVESFEKALS